MILSLLWALIFAIPACFCLYVLATAKDTNKIGMIFFAGANALLAAALAAFPASLFVDNWSLIASLAVAAISFIFSLGLFGVLRSVFSGALQQITQEAEKAKQEAEQMVAAYKEPPKQIYVLDTSALFVGDVIKFINGLFSEGVILVPRFVIDKIQQMASSDDILLSSQGVFGQQVLERLSKESMAPVTIGEDDYAVAPTYEAKLSQLLSEKQAKLICADHNVARILEQEGIQVIFTPVLEEALQPVHFVGQQVAVKISGRGQEPGQGMGFLDDGTKVVVEGGEHFLQQTINAKIQRVYQTVAGKILFATIET